MLETLKNLAAFRLTTRNRKTGLAGKLAKLGIASHLNSGRGVSGKLANAGITLTKAKIGLGVLAAAGLAAGGVAAMRRARAHKSISREW
jgi:hypothetical protein